ncbi:hypothetical protein SteCoe_25176 [Stentor coeruleus]|uniref:Uncharacterized protein n=1 Tax=Stentor coeruleus TaxID=5963 RepID=A0A1R2BG08_9CILI|nr:hypothetical protein SteCoe_25176 [Stentor coeruleus]
MSIGSISSEMLKTSLHLASFENKNLCSSALESYKMVIKPISISSLALNSTYIILGTWESIIEIWDLRTQNKTRILKTNQGKILCLFISEDSFTIISGGEDSTIKIWKGIQEKDYFTLYGHIKPVTSLLFSDYSDMLISASNDKKIKIWDLKNASIIRTLEDHKIKIASLAVSTRFRYPPIYEDHENILNSVFYIASAGEDKKIYLWDVKKNFQLDTLRGHTRFITKVIFSPESNILISICQESRIIIWNVETKCNIGCLQGLRDPSYGLCISSNNNYVYSASGNYIYQWDFHKKILISRKPYTRPGLLEITKNNIFLVFAENYDSLKFIDIEKEFQQAPKNSSSNMILSLCQHKSRRVENTHAQKNNRKIDQKCLPVYTEKISTYPVRVWNLNKNNEKSQD